MSMSLTTQARSQPDVCTKHKQGHYIFMLWFLSSMFFPRLISAAGDWMSIILSHMVWL